MKLDYATLLDIQNNAIHELKVPSLWRHKSGDIYEVIGIDTDSDTGGARVRYTNRVGHVAPGARNPIVFSRPVVEWTKERFTRLV